MAFTIADLAPCVNGWQNTVDRTSLKDGDVLLVARIESYKTHEWVKYETITVFDWETPEDAERDEGDEFEDGIKFADGEGDDWDYDLEDVVGWVNLGQQPTIEHE